MAFNPKSDTWLSPCDLCGSLRYQTFRLPHGRVARRCADCGLVAFARPEGSPRREAAIRHYLPYGLVSGALRGLSPEYGVLVIGVPSASMVDLVAGSGANMTALVEPGTGKVADIPTMEWSLDAASFPPDRFDLIICLRSLESFPVPSLLFDRARLWLRPGGTLLVGAFNFTSLPARLRRRNWLARYAAGAEHMFSLDNVKEYGGRYGFDIKSVRTRSHTDEVASIITGRERPSWMMSMASAPLAFASSLLGMGVVVAVEMVKEGFAVRPLRREMEEAVEGAPGLAPALYTGVQRDGAVDYR